MIIQMKCLRRKGRCFETLQLVLKKWPFIGVNIREE